MDMYQKREMRKNKKMNEDTKSLPSTSINWYPGHMAKTKKQIIEDLKIIDVVIEIIDSRIPMSSQNPDIREYTKGKQRLIVLNKSDLSDGVQNQKWINYFEKNKIPAVLVDSNSGKGIEQAVRKIGEIYTQNEEKFSNKGRIGKSIRVMILGIPNVGKSSFINRITKKNSAQVGNRPGVTRQKQWVRITDNIELLDTPGVLWPKFESEDVGLKLAYIGSIKDDVIETIEIGFNLLKYLIESYRQNVIKRYGITNEKIEEILGQEDLEYNEKIVMIMDEIGKKRGALISGGNIDEEKVAKIILDDFRSGKLGNITLEIAP